MKNASVMAIILFGWLTVSTQCLAETSITEAKSTATDGASRNSAGKDASVTPPAGEAKLVDLNLASREQLMTLPGIGEKEAKKIIEGRPYYTKTELIKRGIIPDETFYGVVEKITINWEAVAKSKREEAKKSFKAVLQAKGKKIKTSSGLVYQDIVKGTGKAAATGMTVKVHYTGWLKDGTKFDSSYDRAAPISFVIGKGAVIRGMEEGVQSMKVGGKRILTIPPKLAYGAKGAGGGVIPPNATLIFEVELVEAGE